jgi:ABC-type sugar transport system ATPase subunit
VTDFTDDSDRPILQACGIGKRYPGVRALHDVTLRLRAGRLLALLGENGAGKSTLMNVLSGVVVPDSGQLLLDGRPVCFASPRDARAQGIATIFQELSLCPNLSVAENIFLGNEPRTRIGFIDHARMRRDARDLLARMSLDVAPEAPLGSLRVGQQQVVEIARALSVDARVLIMDEPTSALSHAEIEALLTRVADLKRAGVAIVYITHKMEELAHIVDDIAIMRDGNLVAHGEVGAFTSEQVLRHMVGREPTAAHEERARGAAGSLVLKVQGASLPHPTRRGDYLVKDVDLQVSRGEVLGIFGLIGAGRTELLETIFGAHARHACLTLEVNGSAQRFSSPADAIAAGLALAPEDRKLDGLALDMSARQNASLACLRAARRWGLLSPQREAACVSHALDRMGVRGSMQGPVRNLSGGNQQKIILAKWLATRPKLLLLDEPTRGIDINARREIYALIDSHVRDGLAVLLASSDINEILTLSDRILVMCEGRAIAEFDRAAASPEALIAAALPRAAVRAAT